MTIRRLHGIAEEERTRKIIGAFFDVYNTLGFGFLESVYTRAMEHELRARGLLVGREVAVRVLYKGEEISWQRVDMLVDDAVVVEIKSTEKLSTSAARQVYNYLRATQLQVGMLLHFGPKPAFYRIFASGTHKKSVHPINPCNPYNPKIESLVSAPTQPRLQHTDPATSREIRNETPPA